MISQASFAELAHRRFDFLSRDFGFIREPTRSSALLSSVVYRQSSLAVEIRFEPREHSIFVYLIELQNDEIPSYLESRDHWLYLEELLWVRGKGEEEALRTLRRTAGTEAGSEGFLTEASRLLRTFGADFLRGDLREFAEVRKRAVKQLGWRAAPT